MRTTTIYNGTGFVLESEHVETYVPDEMVLDPWDEGGPRWSFHVEGRE